MPTGPAARVLDPVVHPMPGVLQPGPGSFNVVIGGKPAWRAIPVGAASGLQAAKAASNARIKVAETATTAASGTPGYPAAKAAEMALKAAEITAMSATIASASGGADKHVCATPLPAHGPGIVINGSPTVLINGLPASRQGDTILEAFGPMNKILLGLPTVIIGQRAGDVSVDLPCMQAAAKAGTPFVRG